MANSFTANVRSIKGAPKSFQCSCGWRNQAVLANFSQGMAEDWVQGHLRQEHGVRDPHVSRTGDLVTIDGIDARLLTKAERTRYQELFANFGRSGPALKAREAPRLVAALFVWMLAFAALGTVMATVDSDDLPDLVVKAVLVSFPVILLGGPLLLLAVAKRDAVSRRERVVAEYLESIGFGARSRTGHRDHLGDDDPVNRFPVTGEYDPSLYMQRGGYETRDAMDMYGIDDYDTYRNNVEESDR